MHSLCISGYTLVIIYVYIYHITIWEFRVMHCIYDCNLIDLYKS